MEGATWCCDIPLLLDAAFLFHGFVYLLYGHPLVPGSRHRYTNQHSATELGMNRPQQRAFEMAVCVSARREERIRLSQASGSLQCALAWEPSLLAVVCMSLRACRSVCERKCVCEREWAAHISGCECMCTLASKPSWRREALLFTGQQGKGGWLIFFGVFL